MSESSPRSDASDRAFSRWSESSLSAGLGLGDGESDLPKKDLYVPHLFDFLFAARDIHYLIQSDLPLTYLSPDAVDSSKPLGAGATFAVSRQAVSQATKPVQQVTKTTTFTVQTLAHRPPRPRYVVYKVANIRFESNGEPSPTHRRAAINFLTELHSLLHPPLLEHANIVEILGLAWGSNPLTPELRLPVLVLEYAEHGSLADVLEHAILEDDVKARLCLDITLGLQALHHCYLVHGDLKADNVLVFTNPEPQPHERGRCRYVAKLADFGYSFVGPAETGSLWISGTDPWKAPETKHPVPVQDAPKSDIYSLGLLAWVVAMNGEDHFRHTLWPGGGRRDYLAAVEEWKQNDELIVRSRVHSWLREWIHQIRLRDCTAELRALATSLVEVEPVSRDLDDGEVAGDMDFPQLGPAESPKVRTGSFFSVLNSIFDKSLTKSPLSRDLDAITELLRSILDRPLEEGPRSDGPSAPGPDPGPTSPQDSLYVMPQDEHTPGPIVAGKPQGGTIYQVTNTSDRTITLTLSESPLPPRPRPVESSSEIPKLRQMWSAKGFKTRMVSWQAVRISRPAIQNLLFRNMASDDVVMLFGSTACLINGYGCGKDVEEACSKLRAAAAQGHQVSRAYLYRICQACGVEMDLSLVTQHLTAMAHNGSRKALEDLRTVDASRAQTIHTRLSLGFGGVGAPWFWPENLLYGLTQPKIMDAKFMSEFLGQQDHPHPETLVANKRGDKLLHIAASCGGVATVRLLIDTYKMDPNTVNAQGETALLCSCRSAQGPMTAMLLQTYHADASIAAKNGESPLHWLVSFGDEIIAPLGKDLLSCGGRIAAETTENVAHSLFPASIDVDVLLPGTPLSWAVHHDRPVIVQWLLDHGADPHHHLSASRQSPIMWAAYFHHDTCLEAMICELERRHAASSSDHKDDPRQALFYGPLIGKAIGSADRFSMMMRHGSQWQQRLHRTLDLLREKTDLISCAPNFGGANRTRLYHAVDGAHDDVVEYMLETGWCSAEVNTPCGTLSHTPIHAAVRWNRREMFYRLLRHGANPRDLARSPLNESDQSFTALHVFADEGHDDDVSLAIKLVDLGVPVDGEEKGEYPGLVMVEDPPKEQSDTGQQREGTRPAAVRRHETPFLVAIRQNAFRLANTLLLLGADIDAVSHSASFLVSAQALTPLGHLIALNARSSSQKLDYLLEGVGRAGFVEPSFVVAPTARCCMTALHRAALGFRHLSTVAGEPLQRADYDFDTNAYMMRKLLRRYRRRDQLDRRTGPDLGGKTALHLAVELGCVDNVRALLEAGASLHVADDAGVGVLDTARSRRHVGPEAGDVLNCLLAWNRRERGSGSENAQDHA
ncbi:serine/threonine protein kinase [Capronia epimyces CBS 606.96]|uniref:Serine/threonine protein kinase n=1 Tax=Capronia epimyces CBS 606.96 TaxID=1182542 RepID=W9YGL5_9EURO|nr:serine/threonine protein kinase [Capronia epimyces CBS 606.96]EXJ91693.1 serine/threonine protein kinase [Capronia epimyces CBS 606.96]